MSQPSRGCSTSCLRKPRFSTTSDELSIEQAFDLFYADLERRDVSFSRSSDPVNDPELFGAIRAPEPELHLLRLVLLALGLVRYGRHAARS